MPDAAGGPRPRRSSVGVSLAGLRLDELLAELQDRLAEIGKTRDRLQGLLDAVVAVCSVLVGDRPVGSADPAGVPVQPGDTVELLPPFAGG